MVFKLINHRLKVASGVVEGAVFVRASERGAVVEYLSSRIKKPAARTERGRLQGYGLNILAT